LAQSSRLKGRVGLAAKMEFTRIGVAQAVARNLNDKVRLVSILEEVGAMGEAQAAAEGYADIVAKCLINPEPEVIAAACAALSNMGMAGADYIGEISGLLGESSALVRAAALEGLGAFGYEARDYAPRVASMVTSESSDYVKAAAIKMLGNVGADEEAEIVKSNLESSSDAVAGAACETLAQMGLMRDNGAILSKMLKKPSTCWSALASLSGMGYQAPVEALESVITIGLAHGDSTYRDQAVCIVGNLGEAAVREPYLGSLKSVLGSSSPGARAAAAMAFGQMGSVAAGEADALLPLLSDAGEETAGAQKAQVIGTNAHRTNACCRLPNAAALWALGQLKACQHLKKIGHCLNDNNWEVRLTALDAVGELGTSAKELGQSVAELLQDSAFPVRAAAARALGHIGADGQAEDLAEALTDQSHSVRLMAVLALADLGEAASSYSHQVFRLIQDPMVAVQAGAVRCLSLMGDIGCNYAGVLATMLNTTSDPELRAEVLDALGRLGNFGSSFVEDVAECLYDKNSMVSDAAMRSLIAMGPLGKPHLVAAGWMAGSENASKQASLPAPSPAQKGYVSALERERAKLGI